MNESTRRIARLRLDGAHLADELWQMAAKWEIFARDSIGVPLVACVDRVGTALAGRGTEDDPGIREQGLRQARAHLRECIYLLWRVRQRALVGEVAFERWRERLQALDSALGDCIDTVATSARARRLSSRSGRAGGSTASAR